MRKQKAIKSPMMQQRICRSFIRSLIKMGLRYKVMKKGGEIYDGNSIYTFNLGLGNGEKCKVRYCDQWGASMFGNRTIHFEFRDCLSISPTKYRSEFQVVGANEKINPKEATKQIIESLTGIKFSRENVQQKRF